MLKQLLEVRTTKKDIKKPMEKEHRSESEERELRKKGGVNSGKTKRRKRTMKSAAKLLLNMPIAQKSVAESLKALGFDEEDLTNRMAMIVSMWKEAEGGNVSAAAWIRSTAGQHAPDIRLREEFEYRIKRDIGANQPIEDLDVIEAEIYGMAESYSEEDSKKGTEKGHDGGERAS